ncbi:MAG: DUF4159 domain-containing protein [Flavobacterium sp.]
MKFFYAFILSVFFGTMQAQELAVLKYNGGGDWYANPTALPNLIQFCNQNIKTKLNPVAATVTPDSNELSLYPFIHMTGHGNVVFSDSEIVNLKKYLLSGGFLHIDDNYGMDEFVRREIKRIFPDQNLQELPTNHPIFNSFYQFPKGLPKIHEHDLGKPQAFGITINGRLVLLYTFETDLGDGWEDPEVHNDPAEIRTKALQMGANLIHYIFNH